MKRWFPSILTLLALFGGLSFWWALKYRASGDASSSLASPGAVASATPEGRVENGLAAVTPGAARSPVASLLEETEGFEQPANDRPARDRGGEGGRMAARPGSRPAELPAGSSPPPRGASRASRPVPAPVRLEQPVRLSELPEEAPPPAGRAKLKTGSIPIETRLVLDGEPISSFVLGKRALSPGVHEVRMERGEDCLSFTVELFPGDVVYLIWDFDVRRWRWHERRGPGGRRVISPPVSNCEREP